MSGTLFIISLSIGNTEDISLHAKKVLEELQTLACEDTRKASRRIKEFGIEKKKSLISLFEHNERDRTPKIIERLHGGESVGLLVDAGTPLVSDPGYILVREAIKNDIHVKILPGPSAIISALVMSGLPPDKFLFLGFPPRKSNARKKFFETYKDLGVTLIFYESPHRISKTLEDVGSVLPDWKIAICRELTKTHEEVIRGTVEEVVHQIGDRKLLGEVTVVLSSK